MKIILSLLVVIITALGVSFQVNVSDRVAKIEAENARLGANQAISALTALTTAGQTDLFAIVDNSGAATTKKITFANLASSTQTQFDLRYSLIAGSASITTLGTITSGTWNGTAIGVGYGGTGTTSPAQYRVLFGNAGSGITIATSTGTTGQFLTSCGANCFPQWTTSAIDQAAFYNFTTIRLASTTIDNPANLGGLSSSFPTTRGSIASVMRDNGSGAWYWGGTPRYTVSSVTQLQATSATFATSSAIVIPAGTLTASSTIEIRGQGSCTSVSGTVTCTTHIRTSNGADIASFINGTPTNGVTHQYHWSGQILNNGSVSAQNYLFGGISFVTGGTEDTIIQQNGTASTNYANAQTLYIVVEASANSTHNLEAYSIVVNP